MFLRVSYLGSLFGFLIWAPYLGSLIGFLIWVSYSGSLFGFLIRASYLGSLFGFLLRVSYSGSSFCFLIQIQILVSPILPPLAIPGVQPKFAVGLMFWRPNGYNNKNIPGSSKERG